MRVHGGFSFCVPPKVHNYVNVQYKRMFRHAARVMACNHNVHAAHGHGAMCIGPPRGGAVRAHADFFTLRAAYGAQLRKRAI